MNVVNHAKVAVLRLGVLALVCAACLFRNTSIAQQQPVFQQPSAVNPVQWVAGPTKASLGDVADITIPDGYQFLDAKSARFFLEGMHNPVPKNLIGILAPTSARWFAVIDYSAVGYVKDTDASQLDPTVMLKQVQSLIARQNEMNSKSGMPAIASAEWELKPVYDSTQNKLEWAIRAATQADMAAVNYSVRLLGRRGVLEVVAIQPYTADFDLSPLRDIVKGVSFQDGERYADYRTGDTIAKASMAQLTAGENSNSSSGPEAAKSSRKMLLWVGVGVAGLLAAGMALFLARKLLRGRPASEARRQSSPAGEMRQPAFLSQEQAGGSQETSAVPAAASPMIQPKSPVAVSQRGARERNGRPSKHNPRKRKKQYNFHLFYSDMIMNLTRWNYLGGFGTYESDYAHINGSTPGQTTEDGNGAADAGKPANGSNGNGASRSLAQSSSVSNGTSSPDAARSLALETSKLIESQQKLIEGQRKLIEEQSKLIKEKSKLIDFDNAVLGKQSELIGEQELL